PDVTKEQECEISDLAQEVLNAREVYSDTTIAQMYDPDHDWLYPELTAAHHALDAAIERAYGLKPDSDEKEIVERLFQLFAKDVNRLSPSASVCELDRHTPTMVMNGLRLQ